MKSQQQSKQYKCPDCGANMQYDPDSGCLKCFHCNNVQEIVKSNDVRERDFKELMTFDCWQDEVEFYRCGNCGAETVLGNNALSTACPYCGSAVVIDNKKDNVVKPNTIIPFELSAEKVTSELARWRKNKIFAPRAFRKQPETDSVKGVYSPVWTFDSYTESIYSGKLGKRRTRTVRRNGKTYTETYIDWFFVNGKINMNFDDILVRGSKNIPEKYFNSLTPFPQSKYCVYNDEYLAGYVADNYTVDPFDAYESAKAVMDSRIHSAILNKYNADVEGHLSIKTEALGRSFKYLFVPVYIANTLYNGKVFNQYVLGMYKNQKVKISGKAPVSPWKVLLAVLMGIGLAVLGYFAGTETYYAEVLSKLPVV